MLSYCLKCRKQPVKTRRLWSQKKGKPMLLSKFTVCDSKKLISIRKQKASGIIGSLANTLSNIPIVGPILF